MVGIGGSTFREGPEGPSVAGSATRHPSPPREEERPPEPTANRKFATANSQCRIGGPIRALCG